MSSKLLTAELERRAARQPPPLYAPPPAATPPPSGGWTPAGVIAVIAALGGPAALSAIGSQVIGAINDRAAAAAELARAQNERVNRLAEEVATARKTCGEALSQANDAASQARAANVIAEGAVKKRGR